MKIKLQTAAISFFMMGLFISGCASASPTTAPGQATAAGETSVPPVAETATLTLTSTATATLAPVYPLIAPETLGQLRLRWNVNFPGDKRDDDPNCEELTQACSLYTNITSYAFSWDGNTLAVGVCLVGTRTVNRSQSDVDVWGCTADSAIILYDSATGEERGRLVSAALPLSLAFHPDGTVLAAGLANSEIELWDVSIGERSSTLSGSPKFGGVYPLAFTPDGSLLISGSGSVIQLLVWDWRSSEPPTTITRAFGFGISADGRSLATLNYGNEFGDPADAIRVYDLAQLSHFSEIPLQGYGGEPTQFYFNPRNGWMAYVDYGFDFIDNAFYWDPAIAAIVATLGEEQELEAGVYIDVTWGGFTPGGYFLLTRMSDFTAEAQPEASGISEPLYACGFALADMEANRIFFPPPMVYDACFAENMSLFYLSGPGAGMQPKISPDGRFIAAEDGFGSLGVWGIDASLPAIAPECSGECPPP